MKVILLEDVKALGKKGDLKEVNDGYAKNFLFPKKLAADANAKNLNELNLKKASENHRAEMALQEAKELAEKLSKFVVEVSLKTGEGGKVFGSISSKEIAAALSAQSGIEIDKKKLVLDEPIKALGSYEAALKLHKDVTAKISVRVAQI